MDSSALLQISFLVLLVLINAFLAASEIAIVTLNDNKYRKLAEEGDKKAKLICNLTNEPSNFLATIQIGITLSGLLASAFASETFADRLTTFIMSTNLSLDQSIVKGVILVVITLLLSYFTLVFGELVPKRIAMQKPEETSMLVIRPLHAFSKVATPFVKFLSLSTNFVIRLFGGDPTVNEENITEEEIRMMVDVGEEKGVILDSEKEMIDNIFDFDDTNVSQVMTHRTDMVTLPITATLDEVMDVIMKEKYTRFPIYEDSIDNIVGIIHVKDLLKYINKSNHDEFNLRDIMWQPYFVPEFKKTDELFKDLKMSKVHMAIVIDEYGGTAGLVTIEDLIEEIVGNILDEYDEEEKEIEKIDDSTFVMDGAVDLEVVEDCLDVELPVEEYDTLSGFLVGQLGRIPKDEEKPVVEFNNIVFRIEKVDEKRISKVKACKA
jgi:putative hemolysin